MTAIVLAAVLGALAVALGVLALAESWRRRPRRSLVAREVIVNLLDGSAVIGFLAEELPDHLVLRNARISERGEEVPIDGEAWVPRDRVSWLQAPTGGKP